TDDRQVLQIFARMNATGVKLNAQEIRNATWFGEFKTAMYELAYEQLERWRRWRLYSEDDIARMKEVEGTSDLANLMLAGTTNKTQKRLNDLYEAYDAVFSERGEVERRFRLTMDAIDDSIGREMPGLVFSNQILFYPLFALFYDLTFGIGSHLSRVSAKKL